MDYQIVATVGPASRSESTWANMLASGATAFRLNTSHLTLESLKEWLDRLAAFRSATGREFPIVLDLQGSKWRIGQLPAAELHEGDEVELIEAESADQPGILPVPHTDFFLAARLAHGSEIALNDAKVRLAPLQTADGRLRCRVVEGGPISAKKGITLTESDFRKEALSGKDRLIFTQTSRLPAVRYAISYVRDSREMAGYRASFGPQAYLIAKIERQPAVDDAEKLAQGADEIWLCRGDLGAELGLKALAETVHRFGHLPARLPLPVFLAGQVLEHMTEHAAPTRAEICHLYESLRKGYAGVVLSDETAIGRHPVEACRTAALFKGI